MAEIYLELGVLETKYRDIADGNKTRKFTVSRISLRLETKYRDIADGNSFPQIHVGCPTSLETKYRDIADRNPTTPPRNPCQRRVENQVPRYSR